MANFFDDLMDMFSGNKKKEQGAEQAPSLLSPITDAWTGFLNRVNESNKQNIQSGHYTVAQPQQTQASPEMDYSMQPQESSWSWEDLARGTADKLTEMITGKKKNPWETDSPFGDKDVDEKFAQAVIELDAADPDMKNKNIFKDAYDITAGYVNDIFASDGLLPLTSEVNPFEVADREWRKALDQRIGEVSAEGKSAEELRAMLEEGHYETEKQHREKQNQGIIDKAQEMRNKENPYYQIMQLTAGEPTAENMQAVGQALTALGDEGRQMMEYMQRMNMTDAQAMDFIRSQAEQRYQPTQMTFDEADRLMNEQYPMYGLAKDTQGSMDDYSAAYGDVRAIGLKAARGEELTDTERQVWSEAVQEMPWLSDWKMNLDSTGKSMDVRFGLNMQQQAELEAYGRTKAQQIADVAGMYSPYELSPKNRAIWEAYTRTPEGAAQWAEDAQGTKDAEKARDNLYFVTQDTKYKEYANRPDYEEKIGQSWDYITGNFGDDMRRGMIWDNLTEEEKQRANAVAAYDGKKAALDYLDYMQYTTDQRINTELETNFRNLGENGVWGGLAASALSVPASLARGAGYIDQAGQEIGKLLTGKPVNRNSAANMLGTVADSAREGVQNQVDWNVNILGQDVDVFDFLYGTAMSGIDSFTAGQLGAALGGIASSAEKAQKVASWTGAAILGTGAAQSAMQDAYDRGANDGTALLMGALAGANETLWEHWSIGNLIKHGQDVGKKTFAEEIKNVLTEAGVNASEEFNTSVANGIAEYFLNHDDREVQKKADEYHRLGLSEDEALEKARGEFWASAVMDAAGGALMGGAFGAVENVQNRQNVNRVDRTMGNGFSPESIETLYSLAESEEASDTAKKLARKFPKEKANARQMGELFRELTQTMGARIKETLHNMGVADIALQIGQETGKIDNAAAEAVTAMMEGETLNGEQVAAIAANPAALRIVDTLFRPDAESGGTSSAADAAPYHQGEGLNNTQEPVQFEQMPGMEEADEARRQAVNAEAPRVGGPAMPAPGKETARAAEARQAENTQAQAEPGKGEASRPRTPTKPPIRVKGREGAYTIEALTMDGTEARVKTSSGETVSLEDADVDADEAAVIRAAADMGDQDAAAAMIATWQQTAEKKRRNEGPVLPAPGKETAREAEARLAEEAEREQGNAGTPRVGGPALPAPGKETARAAEARLAEEAEREQGNAGTPRVGGPAVPAPGKETAREAEARLAEEAERVQENAGTPRVGGPAVPAPGKETARAAEARLAEETERVQENAGTPRVGGPAMPAPGKETAREAEARQEEDAAAGRNFARGFQAEYEAARAGRSVEESQSIYADMLTDEQRQAAREAGERAYAQDEAEADERNEQEAKSAGYRTVKNAGEQAVGVLFGRVSEGIKKGGERVKGMLRLLDEFGKQYGLQVRIYDSMDYGANGSYTRGTNIINLSLDAEEGAITRAASHEGFHFIKNFSPDMAKKITDFVLDKLRKTAGYDLDARIKEVRQQYRDVAGQELEENEDQYQDGAIEEIVADSMLDVIGTQENMKALMQESRSTAEKIKEWIVSTYQKFKDILDRLAKSSPEVAALKDDVDYLGKISEMWNEGMRQAAEAWRQAQVGYNNGTAALEQSQAVQQYRQEMQGDMTAEDRENSLTAFLTNLFGDTQKQWIQQHMEQWEEGLGKFRQALIDYRKNSVALNVALERQGLDTLAGNDIRVASYAADQVMTLEGAKERAKARAENQVDSDSGESYSLPTKKQDDDYMAAVENGDEETARRLVDDAARAAGYVVATYHGTSEKFNEFNMGNEGIHLGDEDVARQVAELRFNWRSKESQYKWADVRDKVDNMDEEQRESLANAAYLLGDYINDSADIFPYEGDLNDTDALTAYVDDLVQRYEENGGGWYGKGKTKLRLRTFDRKTGAYVMKMFAKLGNPFVINGDIGQWTPQNIADVILRRAQGETELGQVDGNVDISGTDIDIDGNALNELEAIAHNGSINEEVWKRLANVLQRLGYDGIKYKNQYEGDKNNWSYIALRPNDVKLADTATYDNAGNVIPLSERFNVGSKDIRYSLPTQQRQEATPIAKDDRGNDLVVELQGGTVASADVKYSFSSLTPREKQHIVDALTKKNFEQAAIEKWMNDLQTIAAIIGADRERLDFVADPGKRMLKKNAEYIKTLDASTLCAKRLLYQGTFDAIQHRLPNTTLLPTDLIDFANMMREMGYETPCGICYVESRRRHLGEFVEKWLAEYQGAYKPTVDQVTTSDGLEELRKTHPQAYQDFISAMNKKGVMNPKIVQLRTDYRGDIRRMGRRQVQKVKDIGGLRIQSFSDFETPHLLDMVQAVMDMAAKELTAQAYTKVPNFAWVFGDTGIKINLSLIGKGKGVDANGNLLFDDKEGMPFDEAMKIRNRYSKNVGTILVGINDRHILAAMADDRIDFIIPFHKSGWSQEELNRMPVLNGYSDYTNSQNERRIIGKDENGDYITESLKKTKRQNFQPVGENGYWEFEKSGKENAEKYLRMCAEDGRMPKFAQFLNDNGDGSWSLQADGSTDGYWKTLIDFKMYDNEGVGSPQTKVLPNINMEEAQRVLNEYTLDRNGIQRKSNNDLPVAQPVVKRYVEEYKRKNPQERYSLPSRQQQGADAVASVRQDAELYAQMRRDADSRAALELLTRMHEQTTQGGENALIKPGAFEKRLGEMVEKIKADTATRMSDRAIRKGLRTIYQAMEKPGYSVGEILTYAKEFYQQVLEQAPGMLVEMDESTKEAVRVLRENAFQLTPDQKSEIKGTYGSLGDYMRKNFGKMKIRNGARVTLADVWRESLNPLNPGLFAEDTAEADMPGIIDAFLENAHEKKFSGEFGANIGAMSTDGALNLMLDFYDVPGAYKQKSEVRAEYQERFDNARALVNQYRQEARQAMNTARAEYQQKYRERIEKDRQTKAEREVKQGVINEIKRNVKPLKTMLVKGTDNRHIPEALRGAIERMLNNLGIDRAIFSGQEAREIYMKLAKWAADSQLHDAAEAAAYDPDILAKLEWLEEHAGKAKALRDMTMAELEAVRDAVQNMYKMVTEENEIEVAGRKRKVADLAGKVMGQMKDKRDASSNPVLAFLRKVGFKEMTPVYYAKQVGGTLGELIQDMIRSESDVAFIIKDGKAAFDKAAEKYHLNDWIHDKKHLRFQTSAGDTIELTREMAMTLYAWAEREKRNTTQSAAHLRRGGFTYDRNDKDVKQMKGVNFTKSHVLSDADIARIRNYLTEEQRGFVETMVKYLSEDMAEKGNEASMRMFGWKKFGEKWYFPYPTDRNFRGKNSTDAKGQPDKQIKYMGSSHALTENAMNPLKLGNFTDIWAGHVDEMARYSVMAEKLDNLQRVTNYVVGGMETETGDVFAPESVKKEIERALGQEGAHYLEQLIRDANGGVMGDERGLSDRFISLFKKGSVAANLSVVLQQPSAFVRAMSMVSPKYFGRGLHEHGGFKATRERMYANSGVANLKQWGGFDTNTGGSFANTLLDSVEKDGKREKAKAFIDEWTGKGAEKADEITWVYMYSAVEAEIDDRTDYRRGTEEFNAAVAQRFDEVMRATQVYDSSMAKSEWMRSTSTMDKIVTSFMAEPTLWINMMMDAALDVKNNAPGARGKAARAVGVFIAGTFVNSLLQSIATAFRRKKDEGMTMAEKYLAEFAGNFTDSLSIEGIAGMIPIARDIVSLFQGYDVERADMAVIGNMIDAWRKMEQHLRKGEMPNVDEWMNLAGMAGNMFGVPVRNIYRDVSGIIMNTFGGASSPIGETSGRDILYSVLDDTSWNSFVKLWDPSNAAYYDRMEQALIKGDMDKYNELRGYLEDTKKVKGDTISTGIKNELKESVLRGLVTEEKAVDIMVDLLGVKDEKTAYDQIDKYVAKAKANGDEDFEYSKYADLMDAVKSGGNVEAEIKRLEDRGNARKTVVSSIKSQVKDWYLAGDMNKAQAEKALKTYVGISDSDNSALYWTLDEWEWLKANPNGSYKTYGNIFDAVDSGNAQKIKAAVQKHLDHPHTKQMATDVHRQITDHFKPIYVELWNKGKKTEAANLKAAILTAYEAAGYARDMKNKDIDKWVK